MPIIVGTFFDSIDSEAIIPEGSAWQGMYNQNEETVKYLVPLIPTFSIFVIVVKVMLNASARGGND